jgi:hypothetical protein
MWYTVVAQTTDIAIAARIPSPAVRNVQRSQPRGKAAPTGGIVAKGAKEIMRKKIDPSL